MKSASSFASKTWILLLTWWIATITAFLIVRGILDSHSSPYDPDVMFTHWSGDRLEVEEGHGVYFVTHLRNLENLSIAELPKAIVAASSGGFSIPSSDLAKLTWIVPPDIHESVFPSATNAVVQPPKPGTPVEALYLFPAHARFRPK